MQNIENGQLAELVGALRRANDRAVERDTSGAGWEAFYERIAALAHAPSHATRPDTRQLTGQEGAVGSAARLPRAR